MSRDMTHADASSLMPTSLLGFMLENENDVSGLSWHALEHTVELSGSATTAFDQRVRARRDNMLSTPATLTEQEVCLSSADQRCEPPPVCLATVLPELLLVVLAQWVYQVRSSC